MCVHDHARALQLQRELKLERCSRGNKTRWSPPRAGIALTTRVVLQRALLGRNTTLTDVKKRRSDAR
jgi:hypothetical protein